MRKNKNTSKIILASLVAILATMISYSTFSKMQTQLVDQQKALDSIQQKKAGEYNDTHAYAVAVRDLKAGEMVADGDVDFKEFDFENPQAYEERSAVVNKVLLKDITAGTMFTNGYIANVSSDSITLKDGYRALTLPGENFQGKSNKMVIGSNVDIYTAASDSDWTLENVKIISFESGKSLPTGGAAAGGTDITNASSITFEVPATRIADFIANISKSKLVLVERNANDKKTISRRSSGHSSGGGGYSSASLPNLPATVPISDYRGGSSLSGLPQPIKPEPIPQSVELIEANVKSKVTFD